MQSPGRVAGAQLQPATGFGFLGLLKMRAEEALHGHSAAPRAWTFSRGGPQPSALSLVRWPFQRQPLSGAAMHPVWAQACVLLCRMGPPDRPCPHALRFVNISA